MICCENLLTFKNGFSGMHLGSETLPKTSEQYYILWLKSRID